MTDLRQAAQAVLERWDSLSWSWSEKSPTADLMAVLRTALEQTEQEPTPWRDMIVATLVREGINKHKARELADHFAAQRPWQGLTDEEIWSAVSRIGTADSDVNPLIILSDARAIEAKLKWKNYY